ncbi:MAG: hypothetical protein US31_C0006G0053 [Berkelbacteria bacterium GW2011_GWA1_36_9]|uniref:Elp3/MiaA/NifB-like radical SAM core domain-containing protein n=1 Tax=Berkelbacteria bacterium GW2011_GWA1_36_9 TaxID=1618331 RepID=A0A0G0FKM9_9BACT|nr:MAG: hypothetical protein US31_C0006G0053 [Berkelbacteria bacterium GW2011_GWA1_36_9]
MKHLNNLYATTEERYNAQFKGIVKQLVVMLPGAGCTWARKSGGCYMCGFSRATYKYTRGRLWPALVFKSMIKLALKQRQKAKILAIYNGGSFLNPEEIPESIPIWLSDRVASTEGIEQLFVESRPEFVNASLINSMMICLGAKTLKIGIGLECVTDIVRNKCVHKGFTVDNYRLAVDIARSNGALTLTYVFLKPPFLTEGEAIEEAVRTVEYAFQSGSNEVALEAAFVQPETFLHQLYEKGGFRPPWLWSIIEVIRRTAHLGPVYLGGFTDEPKPIAIPFNCPVCSEKIYETMQIYRETLDPTIFNCLSCDCLPEWQSVKFLMDRIPILDRVKRSGLYITN